MAEKRRALQRKNSRDLDDGMLMRGSNNPIGVSEEDE